MTKPLSCNGCPLQHASTGYLPGVGTGSSGVMVLTPVPTDAEIREQRPLTGMGSYLFDRICKRAGIESSTLRIEPMIRCRPRGPVSNEAVAFCHAAHLRPSLKAHASTALLALGEEPFRATTYHTDIMRSRGYVLKGSLGIATVGTIHPSTLLPNKGNVTAKDKNPWRFFAAVVMDLMKVATCARDGFRWIEPSYLCDPGVPAFESFIQEYERAGMPMLSYDIETPGRIVFDAEEEDGFDPDSVAIVRIGFCFSPGYAISVPWSGEYLPGITRLLTSAGPKVGWNSYAFDNPVIAAHGITINGELHDGTWAWHILQSDLPRGLEFVGGFYATGLTPWKHTADSEPAKYNAQDNDVQLRNFLGIEKDLKAIGQWDLYESHIRKLDPILREAARRGVAIDIPAQTALREELTTEEAHLLEEIQDLVPYELLPFDIYKRKPEEPAQEIKIDGTFKQCSVCKAPVSNKSEHLKGGKKNPCHGATLVSVKGKVDAYKVLRTFNPMGADLVRYVEYFGHPMGSHPKTGAPTLDKKHLDTLSKKYGHDHPIYALTKDLRNVGKVKGTFLFPSDQHGRIHTEYSYAPSSGRLSSRRPNLQNVTHGSSNPYADRVRSTIIPLEPGHLFVEADSSAIEAVFSGVFMGDPTYCTLARQGIHDYVTCLEMRLPFDPSMLSTYKKDPIYNAARERNKRVVHGTNYGMTPNLMIKLFPEHFPTRKVAIEAQERYFAACPALKIWQHNVRLTAHRQGYLENPWKRRHYFWHVFGKNLKTGAPEVGEDGKRCVSFLPQSSAADFMLDHLLILGDSPWRPYMPANISVHDSLCLSVPESMVDDAVTFLCDTMFREIPQMGNIRVGVECKVGPNWADMSVVRKLTP